MKETVEDNKEEGLVVELKQESSSIRFKAAKTRSETPLDFGYGIILPESLHSFISDHQDRMEVIPTEPPDIDAIIALRKYKEKGKKIEPSAKEKKILELYLLFLDNFVNFALVLFISGLSVFIMLLSILFLR